MLLIGLDHLMIGIVVMSGKKNQKVQGKGHQEKDTGIQEKRGGILSVILE